MVKKYGGESGIESLLNVGKLAHNSNDKKLNESLNQVIHQNLKKNRNKEKNLTSFKGCKSGWKRYSTTFRIEYLEKVKTLAFLQEKNLNEIIDEALGSYLRNKKIEKLR